MSIMELGAIGEFVGAFGVIGSLIYVGVQVKQNTRAMRSETRLGLANAMYQNHYDAALNGDMNQAAREAVVARLRDGRLDIVVATDVAARGLDVERIGLVINFDMPFDVESYVHRIGRTGRAGRAG